MTEHAQRCALPLAAARVRGAGSIPPALRTTPARQTDTDTDLISYPLKKEKYDADSYDHD